MKSTHLFLFSILFYSFCSCAPDQPKDNNVTQAFKVPDSLNDHLLIATFYEPDPAGHTILRYDNESRKSGKIIKFFESSEVYCQDVVPLNDDLFLCKDNNTEYEVLDRIVIARSGGLGTRNISVSNLPEEKEMKRTDQ